MKRLKYAILLLLAILTTKSHGDIIITGQLAVIHARIINLNDYPGIVVFGVWDLPTAPKPIGSYRVESSSWLKMHFAFPLTIYSVKKENLENLDVKEIRWRDNRNVIKSNLIIESRPSDIPKSVHTLEIDYKIGGINDTLMVLYKYKQVFKYGNNRTDSIQYFNDKGEVSELNSDFK